ncbi:MAG: hypothetical protein NPIRA05_20860 [Nitrospirales bacterium]|nr:MAG: hypothetical protein NPIRA05_20860 [Nitrospirales bacterium]
MSIVTDALNRLQSARARGAQPTAAHDPDLSKADTSEPHDGEKTPTVDRTFMSVSIGGFLLALVVAMGAYWWGGYPLSDSPTVILPVSKQTDRSFDLSMDESLDSLSAEQGLSDSAEGVPELLPGELPPLSPSTDDQEHIEIAEAVDGSEGEVTVSFSPHAMAESDSNHESHLELEEVASVSVKHDSVPVPERVEQKSKTDSTSRPRQTVNVAEHAAHAEVISGAMDSDGSSSRPSLSENPELISQSSPSSESTVQSTEPSIVEERSPHARSGNKSASLSLVEVDSHQPARDAEISHEPLPPVLMNSSTEVDPATRLSPEQRILKARLLIEQQSYPEAIAVLQPLFVSPPASWEPWFWMGTAQFGLGELDQAEDAFMEGLVRDETVPYLWVQRAVIEQQRGEYGKAMDALRQAELLDPKLPEVQLNLAYNLEHQGQINLARRHYRRYLTLTDGQSNYHAVRRKVLERMLRM